MQHYEKDRQRTPPCSHPGCYSHVTHPCEGCGRIQGRLSPDTAAISLETFCDGLADVQLVGLTWPKAEQARRGITNVIRRLWRHYEASQEALAQVLAENQVSVAALEEILEEAQGDLDRDIIITACQAVLALEATEGLGER